MDSEVLRDGRILDLIDDAWREDKLPYEDVAIPLVGELLLSITVKTDVFITAPSKKQHKGYCLWYSLFVQDSQDESDSLLSCPVCQSFLWAYKDVDVSLPAPLWGRMLNLLTAGVFFPWHSSGFGTREK